MLCQQQIQNCISNINFENNGNITGDINHKNDTSCQQYKTESTGSTAPTSTPTPTNNTNNTGSTTQSGSGTVINPWSVEVIKQVDTKKLTKEQMIIIAIVIIVLVVLLIIAATN